MVMRISVISFTLKGAELSKQIAELADTCETALFTKCKGYGKDSGGGSNEKTKITPVEESLGSWTKQQMKEKNGLLFIGACGIAVRAIAPYVTDKLQDSPVLVMDEQGTYVIPILSGHVGGANALAFFLADRIGAVPVITTATDLNHKFAVDLFAKRNALWITDKLGIAKISAKVLREENLTMAIEPGHMAEGQELPSCLKLIAYPPKEQVDILITAEETSCLSLLLLRPKEYVIGMGCKKGKEPEKIKSLIERTGKELDISLSQIFALASVTQKSKEAGFLEWSRQNQIPFFTYSPEELGQVPGEFQESEFVKQTVGVANVCERAALAACGAGGRLILQKHSEDGMTIAVAKREWSVAFDEI